jgi:hypothetical protein
VTPKNVRLFKRALVRAFKTQDGILTWRAVVAATSTAVGDVSEAGLAALMQKVVDDDQVMVVSGLFHSV